MTTIIVDDQILSGNLFDDAGYNAGYDENASADRIAEILETKYRAEMTERFPGCKIEVNVDVRHNTSGTGRAIDIIDEDGRLSPDEISSAIFALSDIAGLVYEDFNARAIEEND